MDIGVLLDADQAPPDDLVALARAAEEAGATAAVVTGSTHADAWTLATWIAGSTERIRVGLLEHPVPGAPDDAAATIPAMVDRALSSLEALAPGRSVPAPVSWEPVTAPVSEQDVRAASVNGTPLVSVGSLTDVADLAPVIAAVSAAPAGATVRGAATALRMPGIDYDGVPGSLRGRAYEPGDAEYGRFSSTYLRGGAPGLVLRPHTVAEVADAIAFARRHTHLPLGVRSAGHGISGRSTNRGGLVIDVGAMDGLEVLDRDSRLVRIGPGRTWKRVAYALRPYGWALGSGDYGGVGVGGLATAGGIGLLSRRHGLTIDHLRAVEMVLADGTPIRASDTENAELFWAVRGAGANFGIATSFEFEVYEVGDVAWAQLVLVTDDIERSLREYGRIASEAPRDTTVFFVTGRQRSGQWVVSLFGVVDNPDPQIATERLTPFLELGQLVRQDAVMTPYTGVMDNAADIGPEGQQGFGEPVSRSAFLPALTADFARDAAQLLSTDLVYFFELRAMGGAISDIAPSAMAFSHRSPQFQLAAMSSSDDLLSAQWARMHHHFDGTYLSFETDRHPDRLREAFPPDVLDRLRRLKAQYDPTNLFRDNFNISPEGAASGDVEAGAA